MSKKISQEEIIRRCKKTHGDKYDYSNTVYIKSSEKIEIICPTHGSFFQSPSDHAKGHGCGKCAIEINGLKKRYSTEDYIEAAKKVHGDEFDYSKVEYKTSAQKIEIICSTHGSFFQGPAEHLTGAGCRLCKYMNQSARLTSNTKEFISKAQAIHGDKFDYSKVNYIDSYTKVIIICPTHGEFAQIPNNHLYNEAGCSICRYTNNGIAKRLNTEDFIKKAITVHGELYDYSLVNYITTHDKVDIICPKHGIFNQKASEHTNNKRGCPACSSSQSLPEKFIKNFLIKNDISFVQNDRTIIKPRELDFYLPDHKLAIEYNGTYYHSEITGGKDKNYHLSKTEECEKQGIRLIHILEDEYTDNPKIIITKFKHILGLTKYKIFARKCEIREIDKKTKKIFLEKYHIQGDGQSCIDLGLFYKNRLVEVASFSKRRVSLGADIKDGEYELSRLASINNFNIIGGASKLLKFFERIYTPTKLVSYADRRWSSGNVYEKVGFKKLHNSKPNYWYFLQARNEKRWHRYMFAKHRLQDKLETFDPNLTEWDNMKNNGYDRIWDCGNLVYEKIY